MKYKEPIFEIIKKRRSFRKYQEVDVPHESLKRIRRELKKPLKGLFNITTRIELIELSEGAPTCQTLTSGMVRGARAFLVGVLADTSQNAYIDFGYNFEQAILKATELGLGTCWLGQTFNKNFFSEKLEIRSNKEEIPAISPVGIPAKPGIKESLISFAVKSKRRKNWDKLFFLENFEHPLTPDALADDDFAAILELVRWAPSSRNSQPWRILRTAEDNAYHFYLETKKASSSSALPRMNLLDIGIALCHFTLGIKERKKEGSWIHQEPQIQNKKQATTHYILSWKSKNK